MLRIKNSFVKKAIAAGLMIATVMGTSIPAFASEWHNGYLSHGDIISFKTRMNYDYSDGSWCDIYFYSVSVTYIADGYEENKTNEWHSNASGHAEYNIYQDGRFDESISVITSLDEYGNISDYIY